jgi:pimeloyl-ACP methyl ester carboxylesterase
MNSSKNTNSQFIPSGDALIHCEISGSADAPALLLLHGNGEDLHIFDPHIGIFSQRYRTIAFDTRGHGLSTRGAAPFDFNTFAADLLAVLDALNIGRAHVAGFSDGAITALHAALTAPQRISSMILLGVNCNPKGLLFTQRILIRLVYVWLSAASSFSAAMRLRKEIWGLMVHHPNLDIAGLSRIKIPALIVTGENDMVSRRHNDEISRAIAGSKRITIQGGDHFWMFRKPEIFRRLVMDFV